MDECLKFLLKETDVTDVLSDSPHSAESTESVPSQKDPTDIDRTNSGFFIFEDMNTNKFEEARETSSSFVRGRVPCHQLTNGSFSFCDYPKGSSLVSPSKDRKETNDALDTLSGPEGTDARVQIRTDQSRPSGSARSSPFGQVPKPNPTNQELRKQFLETMDIIRTEKKERQETVTAPLGTIMKEIKETDYEKQIQSLFQSCQMNDALIKEFKQMNKEHIQKCRSFENEIEQLIDRCTESLGLATIGYSKWVCEFCVDLNDIDEEIQNLKTFAGCDL